MAGLSSEVKISATRYKQGGRTVFGLHLTPLQLTTMIHQPNPDVPNPGNRAIVDKHARDFADYYMDHADWVIPGVILRAPSIFKFDIAEGLDPDEAQMGVMRYQQRDALKMQILDGQHRILGFHYALKAIQARIESARDQRSRALRNQGGDKQAPEVREAEARLKAARALEDRMSEERVSVEIQVTDDPQVYRQMFFDIADNAKGITASVKSRFDSRKAVNRALPEILEHPLLKGRVDLENDRLKANGDEYLTAKHVVDIARAADIGINGRYGKRIESTANEHEIAKRAGAFFDLLIDAFPQVRALSVGQVEARTLRTTSLLGSPGMIRALAGTYYDLMHDREWDREKVVAYFGTLAPHLSQRAHRESIWYDRVLLTDEETGAVQRAFNEDAFGPNGRRQDVVAVTEAMTEWAILGKKGAPWVWKAPKEAPPLPVSAEELEDQEVLAAQIETDPLLGELLAAQAAQ